MMSKVDTKEGVFIHELQDLLSAENQLVDALPKMAEASSAPELQQAFREHLGQTRMQVSRLEQALNQIGEKGNGHPCKGMEGLIDEGQDLIKMIPQGMLRDNALMGAAQKVETYEITAYEGAIRKAQELGHTDLATLLRMTLNEEEQTKQRMLRMEESSMTSGRAGMR